jgi:pyridoxine 5-phosphate synthase
MNPLMALLTENSHRSNHTALSVNLNKIAWLRNSRHHDIPNVCKAALTCLQAGAQGITVHPRPDQRHIRPQDVWDLCHLLQEWPQAEFNIEGNPMHNLMELAHQARPHQVTFVPDSVDQLTSDHGWQLPDDIDQLKPYIQQAKNLGLRVSLFMDADPNLMPYVRQAGADRVELYTESYAQAHANGQAQNELRRYAAAAQSALACGLEVNAGHDLNLSNLTEFLGAVPGISEVSIGHALVADALEHGLSATVKAYLRAIQMAGVVN